MGFCFDYAITGALASSTRELSKKTIESEARPDYAKSGREPKEEDRQAYHEGDQKIGEAGEIFQEILD
jgi:hypothetical protein